MKAFIDRIFRNKKLKEELQIEENKKLLAEQIEISIENANKELRAVQNEATQAAIEAIAIKPNHFADCNCFKCERWRNQNAE